MNFEHQAPSRFAAAVQLVIAAAGLRTIFFMFDVLFGGDRSPAAWVVALAILLALFLSAIALGVIFNAMSEFRAAAFQANAIAIMKQKGGPE